MVDKLRRRAARNHRSLQGELISIISDPHILRTGDEENGLEQRIAGPADIDVIVAELRATGYRSPNESVAMIREDRDRADGRR